MVDRLAGRGGGRVEAMTAPRDGGREALLAVFGHEEEAGMFGANSLWGGFGV